MLVLNEKKKISNIISLIQFMQVLSFYALIGFPFSLEAFVLGIYRRGN